MGDSDSRRSGWAVYELHGLRVRSPLPLPGRRHEDGPHDVEVHWGPAKAVPAVAPFGTPVAAAALMGGVSPYLASRHGGRWILRVPGLCEFVITEGLDDVECHADPAADPVMVALVLGGLVVSFLLTLAGRCVLHASAVELEGRATAFSGPSGAGKSTLAALLCSAGATMVTDDVLRIGMDPGPICIGGSPHIRLRRSAEWVLDGFVTAPPVVVTIDDRLAVSPPSASTESVALATVVFPRLSREAEVVEIRPLTGAAALMALGSSSRVTGWIDREVLRAQFCETARIAPELRVLEAVIPWAPVSRATLVDALLALAGGGAVPRVTP